MENKPDFKGAGDFLDRPARNRDGDAFDVNAIFLVTFLGILAALSLGGCSSTQPTENKETTERYERNYEPGYMRR